MKDIIHQMEANAQNSAVLIPRYARINTLRWSVGDAVQGILYNIFLWQFSVGWIKFQVLILHFNNVTVVFLQVSVKFSMSELLALQSEGWSVSNMEPQKDVNWYRNTVLSMTEHQIYIDYHVKTLLIFPPNTDLHQYWMVVDGYLLLQDKVYFFIFSCFGDSIAKFSNLVEPLPCENLYFHQKLVFFFFMLGMD